METIDVLLVLPPMYQSGRIADYNPKEPMGLMYLGACLRGESYSVKILDADILALTLEQTASEIRKQPAKIIGFSALQRALPSIKLLATQLRCERPTSHICCGGFAATLSARHILEQIPAVDSIVLGEGETIFLPLVKAISESAPWKELPGIAFRQGGGVVINRPGVKAAIDSLPWPSRDLLPICLEKTNYATIMSSRGCYGACTFCSNQVFERASSGANWRGRNPSDVVDEIEQLRVGCGVRVFKFNDANLFGPGVDGRQHLVSVCEEMISRNLDDLHLMGFCRSNDIEPTVAQLLKQAGFERLLIGIESANPAVLKLLHKGESLQTICSSIVMLREVGIDIVPGFMIFNPYTTLDTLEIDLDFLETYGFTPILSKSLRIFDGTHLQDIMAAENRLVWCNPLDGYHEYLVDPSIAAIYMALKTIAVDWIDLLHKTYQAELWNIKKAKTFSRRASFNALNRSVFVLEKNALRFLLSWVRSGFSRQDIIGQVTQLRDQLISVEQRIVSSSGLPSPVLDVQNFSVIGLAEKIHSILTTKTICTFPERYRWNDD